MREVHGNARLFGPYLTITTMRKRGNKYVENVQTYLVEDVRPDPAVASPAYSLTKGVLVRSEETGEESFVPSGDVWHVSVNEYGPACDCQHATYSGGQMCKHAKACEAVGLLSKEAP